MLKFASKAAGLLKRFRKDEDGAMTVEWVAIAAAVVVGAVAITWAVLDGLDPVATAIGTNLTDAVGTIEETE
jgi:Flp pilus assembly pilin Flp